VCILLILSTHLYHNVRFKNVNQKNWKLPVSCYVCNLYPHP